MLKFLKDFLINSPGVKTNRKIVIFLVDDYGTIRIASSNALENLKKTIPNITKNRFNKYDDLANSDDLTALFEVLKSVKDKNGNSAVFTPMTVVSNPNFDLIEENNFKKYYYEPFSNTIRERTNGNSILKLWKEGIENKIFLPEFHGREHLNVRFWLEYLQNKDKHVWEAFKHRSIGVESFKKRNKGYMAAFDIENEDHLKNVKEIAKDGLRIFEDIFNYKSVLFTSSSLIHNDGIHEELKKNAIDFIDMARQRIEPNLKGKYKRRYHYMGQKNKFQQYYITRNVMFEPNKNNNNAVNSALKDIALAFKYKKPAIISSHRVNFVGAKSELNRKNGLNDLKNLLQGITSQWPDVEFISFRDINKIFN